MQYRWTDVDSPRITNPKDLRTHIINNHPCCKSEKKGVSIRKGRRLTSASQTLKNTTRWCRHLIIVLVLAFSFVTTIAPRTQRSRYRGFSPGIIAGRSPYWAYSIHRLDGTLLIRDVPADQIRTTKVGLPASGLSRDCDISAIVDHRYTAGVYEKHALLSNVEHMRIAFAFMVECLSRLFSSLVY
jgi:hypothetical protein